jgi:hypothetical protein
MLTQVPLQSVSPVGQGDEQTPLLQVVPVAHRLPHPPQLLLSDVVLTQVPLQLVCPVGQVQTPFEQLLPTPEQIVPHVPQLDVSLRRFVHRPLQTLSPLGQVYWHAPLTHAALPPVG